MRLQLITLVFILGSFVAQGQNCESIIFKKGTSYEMETYDKKNKKVNTSKNTVKDVTESASQMEATVHTEVYNEKSEKETEGDIKFICTGSKILIDMSSFTSSLMGQQAGNMEMKMETSYLEIPSDLSAGQSLPDATVKMKMIDKKSGDEIAVTTINFINRKVEGKQSVTTPAGTFETWKITYDMQSQMRMSMGMNMPMQTMKSVTYFNKEVGMVRTESLDKKGEVNTYSILTKYTK